MKIGVLGSTGEVGKEVVRALWGIAAAKKKKFLPTSSPLTITLFNRREVKKEFYEALSCNNNLSKKDKKNKDADDSEDDDDFTKHFSCVVIDYENLNQIAFANLDACICCLGTTRAKEGPEGTVRVDKNFVINAAKMCKLENCKHFLVVSAANANANSWFVYPKTKGEMEEEVKNLCFSKFTVARPSLILCNRQESRPTEFALRKVVGGIDFANLMSIQASDIAEALVFSAFNDKIEEDSGASIEFVDTKQLVRKAKQFKQVYVGDLRAAQPSRKTSKPASESSAPTPDDKKIVEEHKKTTPKTENTEKAAVEKVEEVCNARVDVDKRVDVVQKMEEVQNVLNSERKVDQIEKIEKIEQSVAKEEETLEKKTKEEKTEAGKAI